jgi:hypothetical protein
MGRMCDNLSDFLASQPAELSEQYPVKLLPYEDSSHSKTIHPSHTHTHSHITSPVECMEKI